MGADPHVSAGNPLCERCQQRCRGAGQHSACSEQSSEAAAPCTQQKEAGDDWRSLLRNQNQHRLTARGPLREGIQGWQPENVTEGMVHGAEPQEIPTGETLPFLDQPYPTNPEQWDSEQLTSESKCKARAQAARGSQAKAEQCPYFP